MNPKIKLFVALPVYRSMDVLTVQSLMRLIYGHAAKGQFDMAIDFHVGDAPIGRARNDLTHRFLENNESTHLLFIDSDIGFSYEQVERIISHGKDIIGGFYTIKTEGNVRPCCNTLNKVDAPDENGLVRMKYMGTGFLCISRRVFEVMIQEIGSKIFYTCDGDHKTIKHDFWRMGVAEDKDGSRRWLSEDWQFCQFALDLGFEIWADAKILLKHSGNAIFPLSYQVAQLYPKDALDRMTAHSQIAVESIQKTGDAPGEIIEAKKEVAA